LHPLRVSSLPDLRIFLSRAIEREREAAINIVIRLKQSRGVNSE